MRVRTMISKYLNNKYLVAIISLTLIITFVILISYSLSFKWNEYQRDSFVDYSTLSQFIAGIGALLAALVAVFLNQINKYFEQTEITIENNKENDKNYDVVKNDHLDIRYYTHLKIINLNKAGLIENCVINLEPGTYDNYILDIPRPFKFAGDSCFKKNIYVEDYIDFAFITIANYNQISAFLTFQINNNIPININILKHSLIKIKISALSPTLNYKTNFYVKFEVDKNIQNWIEKIDKALHIYNKEEKHWEEIGYDDEVGIVGFARFKEDFNFAEFYDLIKIDVERI